MQWTLPEHVIKLCGYKRNVAAHMREEGGSTTHFNECSEKKCILQRGNFARCGDPLL